MDYSSVSRDVGGLCARSTGVTVKTTLSQSKQNIQISLSSFKVVKICSLTLKKAKTYSPTALLKLKSCCYIFISKLFFSCFYYCELLFICLFVFDCNIHDWYFSLIFFNLFASKDFLFCSFSSLRYFAVFCSLFHVLSNSVLFSTTPHVVPIAEGDDSCLQNRRRQLQH